MTDAELREKSAAEKLAAEILDTCHIMLDNRDGALMSRPPAVVPLNDYAKATHLITAHVALARAAALLAAAEHTLIYDNKGHYRCTCGKFHNAASSRPPQLDWADHVRALAAAKQAGANEAHAIGYRDAVIALRKPGPCPKGHPAMFWVDKCHHCCEFLETNGTKPHDCGSYCTLCEEQADIECAARLNEVMNIGHYNGCATLLVTRDPYPPCDCGIGDRIAALQPGTDKERK